MVEATEKPVTVKMRLGMDSQNINGVKVAMMLQKAGVAHYVFMVGLLSKNSPEKLTGQ